MRTSERHSPFLGLTNIVHPLIANEKTKHNMGTVLYIACVLNRSLFLSLWSQKWYERRLEPRLLLLQHHYIYMSSCVFLKDVSTNCFCALLCALNSHSDVMLGHPLSVHAVEETQRYTALVTISISAMHGLYYSLKVR